MKKKNLKVPKVEEAQEKEDSGLFDLEEEPEFE